MPIYETVDGHLAAVDPRPLADEPEPQSTSPRSYTKTRDAAAHGTLDDMAEAVVREAYGQMLEPYADSLVMQGYRDIGGASGPGPWQGPIDLLPEARRQEVQWARTLALFSPPAKNAIRLHRTYVLGQGIPMPTAPDGDVQQVIEEFWDDSSNDELTSHQGQAETDASWITTGELFLALYVDGDDGHVKVRSVEPLDVDCVVTDPNDRKRILYYRVRQHRDTFNFNLGQAEDDIQAGAADEFVYFPDWQNTDPERDPYKSAATPKAPGGAVMASFPLNRQGVRGIPEFCAATPWIHSHKRLIENQSIMSEARKRIALIKTVKGGPQAVGSSAALDQSSLSADMSRLERNPARAPGSTYVKNKGIELEYPDLSTGADDAQRDAELQAQMIGSAMGWGTHYLLMSTEFHRLATAVTMELPTLKMCLEGQQRWLDMLRSVLDFCLLHAAKAGTINAPVVTKHGRDLVDWKKAEPAPPAEGDEDGQDKESDDRLTVADAREMATVLGQQTGWYLEQADRKQAGGDPDSAAEYRRLADRCVQRRAGLAVLVREAEGDQPTAKARETASGIGQADAYLRRAAYYRQMGQSAEADEYITMARQVRETEHDRTPNAERQTPIREMEPQDVLAQAQAHKDGDKPRAKAKYDQAKRGTYQCEMPPILERDLLPTIQAVEAAAGAGHITPEQAARQIMLVLGFGEVDDALAAWRSWVALKGSEIEKDAQQAQDLAHKTLAAKAGGPPGAAPDAAGTAQPKTPGSGQAPPSGGMSRAPVREGIAVAGNLNPLAMKDSTDSDPKTDPKTDADPDAETGVMVALFVPPDAAQYLALPDGEEPSELHLTLCFLGKKSAYSRAQLERLPHVVAPVVARHAPLQGRVRGLDTFAPTSHSDGKEVLYAAVDIPGLLPLRRDLVKALDAAGYMVAQNFAFTPHITLRYQDPGTRGPDYDPAVALSLDAVTVAMGAQQTALPLAHASE